MDFANISWLFAVLGGAAVLGLALAYGVYTSKKASRAQRKQAEQGARDLYHKEQSKS